MKNFFNAIGPGVITGASDDDPSAITTYSIAGALFGYKLLWLVILIIPLLFIVQFLSARLGKVTGKGLAENIKDNFPKPVLIVSCIMLISANIFQLGASLGGISSLMQLITGIPEFIWIIFFAALISFSLSFFHYNKLKEIFRWFVLALFAYIAAALLSDTDWKSVLHSSFIPEISFSKKFISAMVGIVGSAVSPYIFYWQAVQIIEEKKSDENSLSIRNTGQEVFTGILFACIIIYFIILSAANTLHKQGIEQITSADQIASALQPVAGEFAIYLFAIGFVGSAMLGIPALAGSIGFAFSESFKWKNSTLAHSVFDSPKFYSVILAALIGGSLTYFLGINPIDMLFISAVINGMLAAPLIVLLILLTSSGKVMKEKKNSLILTIAAWLTAIIIAICALLFFII